MGLAARQRVVDHYSIDKVADRYEALFSEVLSNLVNGFNSRSWELLLQRKI